MTGVRFLAEELEYILGHRFRNVGRGQPRLTTLFQQVAFSLGIKEAAV
jgi:hypothetical protein